MPRDMKREVGSALRIRKAVASDAPVVHEFIRALALYEKEPEAVIATEADLLRHGFGEEPRFFVLLAEETNGGATDRGAGRALGFALYFFTYSTWEGAPCLFLEDLFVPEEHRGRGVGLALMRALAAEAVRAGCTRFQWQVLDWNAPSIAFYEQLGAKILHGWQSVRLEGDALAKLAESKAPG